MYSSAVWPVAVASAPAGAEAPKLETGVARWVSVTPPRAAAMAS